MSRKDLAKTLMAFAVIGASSPGIGLAEGRSLNPPGYSKAMLHRVANGPSKPSPSNRGGRGFEQRVLHSMRDFEDHVSCHPPLRPHSP